MSQNTAYSPLGSLHGGPNCTRAAQINTFALFLVDICGRHSFWVLLQCLQNGLKGKRHKTWTSISHLVGNALVNTPSFTVGPWRKSPLLVLFIHSLSSCSDMIPRFVLSQVRSGQALEPIGLRENHDDTMETTTHCELFAQTRQQPVNTLLLLGILSSLHSEYISVGQSTVHCRAK